MVSKISFFLYYKSNLFFYFKVTELPSTSKNINYKNFQIHKRFNIKSSSKSWHAWVTVVISDKTFWTMIALFFLWIVLSRSWACNTVFTVPERQVAWANAFVFVFLVNHLSSLDSFTLALIGSWVNFSWSLTLETFTSSSGFTVGVVSRAWLALWIDWIEKQWSSTSDTVVPNFDESCGTTWLNLELIPTWVSNWECSWTLLSKDACDKGKEEKSFEWRIGHGKSNFNYNEVELNSNLKSC